MSIEQDIEQATAAMQTSALLGSDLATLCRSTNPLVADAALELCKCNADIKRRLENFVGSLQALQQLDEGKLAQVQNAVRDYHLALDERKHGGSAGNELTYKVQAILDMHWIQGAEQKRRSE